MPRVSKVCVLFSYNKKSLIQINFLLCTFKNFVPLPHSFQFIPYPVEFCLCYLLWMYSFLIIPTLISLVSHLKPYLLMWLDNESIVYCSNLLSLLAFVSSFTLLSFSPPRWKHRKAPTFRIEGLELSIYCFTGSASLY